MRANTRHQVREWKMVFWILLVSWWWLPVKFIIWFFVQVFRAIVWTIEEVNDIGRSRFGSW